MAYSEALAERVRDLLLARSGVSERRMFGGVAWMVDGNMACGVLGEDLIVRMERDEAEAALADEHVRPFEATGRRMGGFVVVEPGGTAADADLARWVDAGADRAASLPPK